MNTINRVIIVVALLLLIPVVSYVLVTPHTVLTTVGGALSDLGLRVNGMTVAVRLALGIVLALAFDALALIIIFFEVRRPRKRFIRVQQASGGMATLGVESIAEQLQYHLDPVAGVLKVKPVIKAKGEKVEAAVDVTVAAGSNVPEMANSLVEIVRRVLTVDLGLQAAGEPHVRINVAAAPAQPPARPSTPAKPATPPVKPVTPPTDGGTRLWTGPEEAPEREPLA